jgi:hypothetical protein
MKTKTPESSHTDVATSKIKNTAPLLSLSSPPGNRTALTEYKRFSFEPVGRNVDGTTHVERRAGLSLPASVRRSTSSRIGLPG